MLRYGFVQNRGRGGGKADIWLDGRYSGRGLDVEFVPQGHELRAETAQALLQMDGLV